MLFIESVWTMVNQQDESQNCLPIPRVSDSGFMRPDAKWDLEISQRVYETAFHTGSLGPNTQQ